MSDADCDQSIPKLKIAILVVGTRGDVQPFLALSLRLQEYGHSVRLATHSDFDEFVKSAGVDFYPIDGDPRILTEYWVRAKTIISPFVMGDLPRQRQQIKAFIHSLFPACTEPDPITGEPFRAHAIIANPLTFGVADVAEALGVPLHMFFVAPWTPTNAVPSPFLYTGLPKLVGNRLSYNIVYFLMWWVVRGFINDLRKKKLGLAPIACFNASNISLSRFPITYVWSTHVLPKPNDWGALVDVVGYCYLNLGSNYEPPTEFVEWMQKGHKPVYIGFGSMPIKDSERVTAIILEALKKTGQRGILNRGWGNLGTHPNIPEDVFLVADCPHDWLFPQCSAVVHHGGCGTTAAGLKAGCPTTIIPFLMDQFLWGDIMFEKGIGPTPVTISQLTVEYLSEAITFMLQPQVKSRAMKLAELILKDEDGATAAVEAFHRHLPPEPTPYPGKDDGDPNRLHWFRSSLVCGSLALILYIGKKVARGGVSLS